MKDKFIMMNGALINQELVIADKQYEGKFNVIVYMYIETKNQVVLKYLFLIIHNKLLLVPIFM